MRRPEREAVLGSSCRDKQPKDQESQRETAAKSRSYNNKRHEEQGRQKSVATKGRTHKEKMLPSGGPATRGTYKEQEPRREHAETGRKEEVRQDGCLPDEEGGIRLEQERFAGPIGLNGIEAGLGSSNLLPSEISIYAAGKHIEYRERTRRATPNRSYCYCLPLS